MRKTHDSTAHSKAIATLDVVVAVVVVPENVLAMRRRKRMWQQMIKWQKMRLSLVTGRRR